MFKRLLTIIYLLGITYTGLCQDVHTVNPVVIPPLTDSFYVVPSGTTRNVTSSESIVLRPGTSLVSGSTVSLTIQNPPGMSTVLLRSYVQTDNIKVAGITSAGAIDALTAYQKQTQITYMDGLGRAVQTVALKGSPTRTDLVQFNNYDNLGRLTTNYLPYAVTDSSGIFHLNAMNQQKAFYQATGDNIADDTMPFSQTIIENSPLQRLLQAGSVGDGFQPGQHYQAANYNTNLSTDQVINWDFSGVNQGYYASGLLTVTEAIDAQGGHTLIYKDKSGHTLLKRQLADNVTVTYNDTYYVYNTAGQISYVIPPKAIAAMKTSGNWDITQTAVNKLLFKYTYNTHGLPTIKTVPSAGDVYIVYDPLFRPVLIQDANMRTNNQWNYIKYDGKGRAIGQGIYTDNTYTSLSAMQTYVSGLDYSTVYFEDRSTSSSTGYYTNNVFPTTGTDPLAYSYYDNYDINNDGTADYAYISQGLVNESTATLLTRGMLTATVKRTVGQGISTTWLTSVVFYNKRGVMIQTQSNNLLQTAVNDKTTIVPDFIGLTKQVKTVKNNASGSITVLSTYTYDHSSRILSVDQSYNGGSTIRVGKYAYNQIGQLVNKQLHSTNTGFTSYLQTLNYGYNIRGQLLGINNSTLTGDATAVFGMQLLYEQVDAGLSNTANYNGSISAIKWMSKDASGTNGNERSYKYDYDLLNRLKDGYYADRAGSGAWGNIGAYDEKNINYDENGNITALKRNALLSGTISEIDNLTYSYDGNRLSNVTDGTGSNYTSYGFRNYTASTTAYDYDDNGNLKQDYKKGIAFTYNVLNRVDQETLSVGKLTYTYNASGTLLRKQEFNSSNVLQNTTDYIDGFQYLNGTLSYFAMPEGRVRNNSGTLTNEYVITDQQGNARVSFQDNGSGVAMVRQENSYYAFGLTLTGSTVSTPTDANKRLYNGGSELQNDFSNLPDLMQTFFRNYDATLGRWTGVDPMAEGAESLSTYQYAGNNPVMMNDPMGNISQEAYNAVWRIINDNLPITQDKYYGPDDSAPSDFGDGGPGGSGSGGGGGSGGGSESPFMRAIDYNNFFNTWGKNGVVSSPQAAILNYDMTRPPGTDAITTSQLSIWLPDVDIKDIESGNLPSWWGNSQLFLDAHHSYSGQTQIANDDNTGFSFGKADDWSKAKNLLKVNDLAVTTTSVTKLIVDLSKNVKWVGVKSFDILGDVTGAISVFQNGKAAYDDFSSGRYGLGIWNTAKFVGTSGFLIFGGEEATVAVRGAQALWNVGVTYFDYKIPE